jgi:hypothetical protein
LVPLEELRRPIRTCGAGRSTVRSAATAGNSTPSILLASNQGRSAATVAVHRPAGTAGGGLSTGTLPVLVS